MAVIETRVGEKIKELERKAEVKEREGRKRNILVKKLKPKKREERECVKK